MELAQVGVRTRARAVAMAAAAATSGTAKRRKVSGGNGELRFDSSCVQLRSSTRRRVLISPENSVSPATSHKTEPAVLKERVSSPSSDYSPASCCSSNGSSEQVNDSLKFTDLEDESFGVETSSYFDCRERRETTPPSAVSDVMESTARPSEANSRLKLTLPSDEKMPLQSEIDEFFAAAEKENQKRFAEKYNYDTVKDVPLEGRYEWVRLKP